MGKPYITISILAILTLLLHSCGGGDSHSTPEAEQAYLDSLVKSVEVVQPESAPEAVKVDNSKVVTNFIDDGRLRKEEKIFIFLKDRVIINKDTIFVDSKKDSTFVGYDVIDFPYKQVRPHTIKKTSNGVKIDNINYYVNLPLSRKKVHIIEAGQTRSKLLKLGIPDQYIPDIPTIGTKIEYYE